MISITEFQVNGRQNVAVTDSSEFFCALYVEGPVEEMCFQLYQGEVLCWESGVMRWRPHFELSDLPLMACSKYRLEAVVLAGEETDRAELVLHTGLMGSAWQAHWIEPEQEPGIKEREIQFFEQFVPMPDHFGGHGRLRPVQELRRVFQVEKRPEKATLCASAHGVYALWLNGRRVDERRLAPETTPYETMLYYQVYDLTELIRAGENTLRVLLADGWWIGRIGLTGDSCQYGDKLGFLAQLELDHGSGVIETIVTDNRFESRPSCIKYADLMMGEKWDMNGSEASWTACKDAGEAGDGLVLQTMAPIEVWTTLDPVALMTTPNGELVADFGQCLAGVVELKVNCPAGREIQLDHSETLDTEGNFFRNILGRNKDQEDKVVCGKEETYFCPEFTYHGFRYVRLTGVSREEVLFVRAKAIGTPIEKIGSFECSHDGLNQLQHNIEWSTRSNMVSVPTDCPQREKVGWTGDIQVFAPTGCFNYDLHGFLSAWLTQLRLTQEPNGAVPIVAPSYPEQTKMQVKTNGDNTSAAWSDACVLLPLTIYKATGDKKVLRDNLDMMEKWMDFVANASHDYLWTDGFHFGDWLIPSFQNDIEGGTAATAKGIAAFQYAITAASVIEVLEALDEPTEKIKKHSTLLENIRKAVSKAFIHEDGSIDGDLQGLYVMALRSGVAEPELAQKVADRLESIIEANDGGLNTGFVSTPHLLDMLVAYGHEDRAWKMLFRTESPSWLYQVEKGATTIWENWNAIRPDGTVTTSSYNHYSLGAVGSWIYRHIGGLNCLAPGWETIEYAPAIDCGLKWAACSHQTPYGLAACRWERDGGKTFVEVTVPYGASATLRLPGLEQNLVAGVHTFTV